MKVDNTCCSIWASLVIFNQEYMKAMPSSNWNIQEGGQRGGVITLAEASLDLKFCNSYCTGVRIKIIYCWYPVLTIPQPQ